LKNADMILTGGTVVTMNDSYDVIHQGAIAIQDGKIIAVDTAQAIAEAYTAEDIIDCQGHYIMPGLVNAHTHVPMTLLRGLADDLRLDVWLMGYMMPVEREFVNSDFCRLGTSLACAEMIRTGTTTFADMYYYESDVAETTAEIGLRAFLCESILKFPAPDAPTYEDSLAYTREFIERWQDHPLITPSIAPHAPYSNTEETLQKSRDIALEYGLPLMIHIAETKREQDDSMEEYGKTVVPWIKDVGVLDAKIIAAHCVHIDDHEMRMLRKHDASVAHCPSANLKLASGIAPITQMLDLGLNVAIGTDGPASNNDLDMFEEMRLAALLAKVTPINPISLPARQALEMATRNGAKALGMEDQIGSLDVGKYADVIVVDSQTMHNSPQFDFNPQAVYSQLVYAVKGSDVRDTIVHGKVLMRERQLLTVDENKVRDEARAYAERVGKFLSQREGNTLSKLVAVGIDVERSESFEIQMKARISDMSVVENLLVHDDVEVVRSVHYRQFDTYFTFDDARVRYREDDMMREDGQVDKVRMRLTYTSGERERILNDAVLLSHSRFIAPASHPLRFYQEYFQAEHELKLKKERRRWRILYKGVLYYLNVDRLLEPSVDGLFIEVKSRTWSLSDAEAKAKFIHEIMDILEITHDDLVREEYLEMAVEKD
jgi:5-methylthioadenosine/S-adenosylhomocysteine deaminase